jgi:hypothetical protein
MSTQLESPPLDTDFPGILAGMAAINADYDEQLAAAQTRAAEVMTPLQQEQTRLQARQGRVADELAQAMAAVDLEALERLRSESTHLPIKLAAVQVRIKEAALAAALEHDRLAKARLVALQPAMDATDVLWQHYTEDRMRIVSLRQQVYMLSGTGMVNDCRRDVDQAQAALARLVQAQAAPVAR